MRTMSAMGSVERQSELALALDASQTCLYACDSGSLYLEWLHQNRPDVLQKLLDGGQCRIDSPVATSAEGSAPSLYSLLDDADDLAGRISPFIEGGISLYKVSQELPLSTEFYIKSHAGKKYVIFKGDRSLRESLKGTRYLANNPKVAAIGLAPKSVGAGVKGGSVMMVLDVALNVAKYITADADEYTLGTLLAQSTTDVAKGVLSGVIGTLIGNAAFGAMAATGTMVAAPIVAGVAIAVLVGLGLNWLDNQLGITDRLAVVLDEALDAMDSWWDRQMDALGRGVLEFERQFIWHFSGGFDIRNPGGF